MQSAVARLCRVLTVLGAMIAVSVLVLAAVVTPSATATSSPEQMNDSVKINLRGRVMPRCMLTGLETPMSASAGAAGTGRVEQRRRFEVNCNAPFRVSLSSVYGGLRHSKGNVFPYRASLVIATDSGRTVTLDCAASRLVPDAGDCVGNSGDDTAVGKEAVLIVNWLKPEGASAGTYTDDLRLSLGVQD
jgi:hypothetical protein